MIKKTCKTIAVLGAVAWSAFPALADDASQIKIVPCASSQSFKDCAAITITSPITTQTADEFVLRTTGVARAIVYLSGPGGDLMNAINAGETIHAKRYATTVADGQICESACAVIWLAGSDHTLGEGAILYFHPALVPGTSDEFEGLGNVLLGMYLAHLGYSNTTVSSLFKSHSPQDIHVVKGVGDTTWQNDLVYIGPKQKCAD